MKPLPLASLLLSGCVLWMPRNARTPHGLLQLRQDDQLATVLPLGMSREHVLGTIGVPDRVLDGGSHLLWLASCQESSLLVVGPNLGGEIPLGHDYALLLVFDAGGRLVARTLSRTGLGDWPRLAARMVGEVGR